MRIVSVQAPCQDSGKTRLCVRILEAFPAFAAAKISTVSRPPGCPGARQPGDAAEFTILDHPALLARPGTDTGRFAATGAPTFWMLCPPGGHAAGWAALRARLPEGRPLLIEGSRITEVCQPDLRIMVVNPRRPRACWKAGAEADLERADLVLANPHGPGPDDPGIAALLERLGAVREVERVLERVGRLLAE